MTEKNGHILIVDDSPDDIQFLIENLKDKYAVMPATSGVKALKMASNAPQPDVILMDVEMPEMNGYETCRRLKENPETCNISVIFVSAHDTTEEKMAGYEAGGSDYVIKPLNPDELNQKVEVAVRDRRVRNELQAEKDNIMSGFMEVLTSSGEQGVVLEFLRNSFAIPASDSLAKMLIDAVSKYSLLATVQMRTSAETVNAGSNGPVAPLEQELLSRLMNQGRIMEKGARLILNHGGVSLLIKNFPDDELIRGRLRDHLAILVEGAAAKLKAIELANKEDERKASILKMVSDSTAELQEIQQAQRQHHTENMQIMDEMLQNLEASFVALGLTEEQEHALVRMVEAGVSKSLDHYEAGLTQDERFEELINRFAILA